MRSVRAAWRCSSSRFRSSSTLRRLCSAAALAGSRSTSATSEDVCAKSKADWPLALVRPKSAFASSSSNTKSRSPMPAASMSGVSCSSASEVLTLAPSSSKARVVSNLVSRMLVSAELRTAKISGVSPSKFAAFTPLPAATRRLARAAPEADSVGRPAHACSTVSPSELTKLRSMVAESERAIKASTFLVSCRAASTRKYVSLHWPTLRKTGPKFR
mmetsp:Transcript_119643/g.381811  ORF Transcript_119643/g.381811 Transcript_119643/m.381811 type:complete len:216 (+) Transcript_119643:1381-2028(+)